jgi:hypothetical protein
MVSRSFTETAGTLRDRLVTGAGFERREVGEFITTARLEQGRLDFDRHAGRSVYQPVVISLPEKLDLGIEAVGWAVPLRDGQGQALGVDRRATAAARYQPTNSEPMIRLLSVSFSKSRSSTYWFM